MLRYGISQFDGSTYVVIDRILKKEVCVCSRYEGGLDYKRRAKTIAYALNDHIKETKSGTRIAGHSGSK